MDKDDNIAFCDHKKCLENRRNAIRNFTSFNCSHIEKAKNAILNDEVLTL